MTQVDILLRHLPESYDITVGHKHSYDIVLQDKRQSYDIYIYNLVNRQGIYGDELSPLIFRLTENAVDCLLDVSLFETALLYGYDSRVLDTLDKFPIFVLEHGGGYNYFALKESNVNLTKKMYAGLKDNISRLITEADTSLSKSISSKQTELKLITSGDLTNTVTTQTLATSAHLSTHITSSIRKICELMLNICGVHWFDGRLCEYDDMLLSDMYISLPKMSLVTTMGKMYMKFSFDIKDNTIKLNDNIEDFITTVNFKDTIRSVMHLKADASFSYEIICSCKPQSTSLANNEISLKIKAYIKPLEMSESFSNYIGQDILTRSALGITSQDKLETTITEGLELHYGFGYYDRQYLYYWDSHTISDMGAEIPNKSSSVSVDI